jgi:hypothetical protein
LHVQWSALIPTRNLRVLLVSLWLATSQPGENERQPRLQVAEILVKPLHLPQDPPPAACHWLEVGPAVQKMILMDLLLQPRVYRARLSSPAELLENGSLAISGIKLR